LPNQNDVFCPAIGYFLNTDTAFEPKTVYQNDSKMCTFVENSCCSAYEMNSIRNWWESKPSYGKDRSRFETKKDRLYLIESFTHDLIAKKDFFSDFSKKIKEEKSSKYEGYCKDYASKFLESDFTELDNYLKYTESCWTTMNKIQNGIMCFACEPFAQASLGFEDKQITLGGSILKILNNNCKELAWTMHKVLIPYFLMVNKLMKCDEETGKELDEVIVFNYNSQSNQYLEEVPGSTILEAKIDEKMFPQFFSFGTRINVNIEGKLDYLMSLVRLVRTFLAKVSIVNLSKQIKSTPKTVEKVDEKKEQKDEIKVEAEEKTPETKPEEKVEPVKTQDAITKEKAIELLDEYVTELEKQHKNTQQITDLLAKKKDEIQMSDNIADDAVVVIGDYKYDRISAHEALDQLKDKVAEFKKEKKFTLIQEQMIKYLKKQFLKKLRPDQPYVFMKKLKAFEW